MPKLGTNQLFPPPGIKPRDQILVMGVGGAGCNSVARIAAQWTEGPSVVAVNSDAQALSSCGVDRTLLIGEKATRNLGAAGDANVGRLAAEESIAALQDMVAGTDLLILVGGMGRGTATGAMPVIAKIARELGVLTLAFVSAPFALEGDRIRRQADEGIHQLRRHAGAVIVQPNDRLLKLAAADVSLEEAFSVSDKMVAEGIYSLWYLLSRPGVINITFADIQELAERCGGMLSYVYAEARGPARVASVLRNLMDSPLLEHGQLLSEAQGVLVNIAGGPELTIADMQGIMSTIRSSVRENAHISMGALIDPAHRERIAITLFASETWREDQKESAIAPPSSTDSQADDAMQTELALGDLKPQDRGLFGDSSATFINGEDLDIPTYIRRGVKLSFER